MWRRIATRAVAGWHQVAARSVAAWRRLRRLERRELAAARRWLSNTTNLQRASALLFVPLCIALVTLLSNSARELSFLLFPPLASGAYTLFSDPEGRYASPRQFVVGLTAGAACGWGAEVLAAGLAPVPRGVNPVSAGLSLLLTGVVTWGLEADEPAAFSTALLVLVTGAASPLEYVGSVAVSSSMVALAFYVWRERVYERRAAYLYGTTSGDDHVLVPMVGETAPAVARFAARLAAAHDAGKVVLLALVETGERGPAVDSPAHLERHPPSAGGDGAAGGPDGDGDAAGGEPVAAVAARLESEAATVRSDYGVPCEVAVAGGDPTEATFRTARETNCDLVVAPYETDDGQFSAFAGEVLAGPLDAVLLDTDPGRRRWERVLVMVSRPGDSAHAMVDFAERLTRGTGRVSVCTCIDREVERRPAETRLANLVGTVDSGIETRVARSDVDSFLAANADAYDLVVVGSSGDRSPVSRLLSPPTAARLDDLACDLAVVDRADP